MRKLNSALHPHQKLETAAHDDVYASALETEKVTHDDSASALETEKVTHDDVACGRMAHQILKKIMGLAIGIK